MTTARNEVAVLNPLHVLVDLETTSLSAEARIIGLAAAVVDREMMDDGHHSAMLLFQRFPISAVEQPARVIDPRTMEWWAGVEGDPSKKAQAAMLGEGGTLVQAIIDLLEAVIERAAGRPVLWWGDPSAFDGALMLTVLDPMRLGGAAVDDPLAAQLLPLAGLEYEKCGLGRHPLYKRSLDLSTLKWQAALANETVPDIYPLIPHDPVEDVMAAGRELAELLTRTYARRA